VRQRDNQEKEQEKEEKMIRGVRMQVSQLKENYE
jgi:hypothetical protein